MLIFNRPFAIERIHASFHIHPATALLGPRQCCKTTLARMLAENEAVYSFFELEKAVDRRKLEHPEQTLSQLTGLVIIKDP